MVKFLAPKESGSYFATFRLVADGDREFGDKIHLRLIVGQPESVQIDSGKQQVMNKPIDQQKLEALITTAMSQINM